MAACNPIDFTWTRIPRATERLLFLIRSLFFLGVSFNEARPSCRWSNAYFCIWLKWGRTRTLCLEKELPVNFVKTLERKKNHISWASPSLSVNRRRKNPLLFARGGHVIDRPHCCPWSESSQSMQGCPLNALMTRMNKLVLLPMSQ